MSSKNGNIPNDTILEAPEESSSSDHAAAQPVPAPAPAPPPEPPTVPGPPPPFVPQIAIENVEFIEEDQRRKQLEAKVNRHKSKKQINRHKRNSSLGRTPSIDEEPPQYYVNDQEWLQAVTAQPPLTSSQEQQQEQQHHGSFIEQEEQQGEQQEYYVPISEQLQQPQQPTQQQQQQKQSSVGYAPWPVKPDLHHYQEPKRHRHRRSHSGASSLASDEVPASLVAMEQQQQLQQQHPLKQDKHQQFLRHEQQPPDDDDDMIDDEYAALLQQNFSSGSAGSGGGVAYGYGATASSQYQNQQQQPKPRRSSSASTSQQQRRIAADSLTQWPPRKGSEGGAGAGGSYTASGAQLPPPPPPPTQQQQQQQQQQWGHPSPPHVPHRRASSDNYSYNQHPLLRNNTPLDMTPPNSSSSRPPKSSGRSPNSQGNLPRSTIPLQAPHSAGQYNRKSYSESAGFVSSVPGHRRVRSGSGGSMGGGIGTGGAGGLLRNVNPPLSGSALPPGFGSSSSGKLPSPAGGGQHRRSSSSGRLSSPVGGGQHHRRSSSMASSSGMSVASEASFMSVVSDIRKSSFYGGYDEATGNTQMHYPNENVHLSTNKQLQKGWIYQIPVDPEEFEEYHRAAEEAMIWEDEELHHEVHKCGCKCPACYHGCTGHTANKSRKPKDPFSMLPVNTYALAVHDDIYKNVLEEINQSHTMPCGLFYCGHHEDVDHPSIMIPVCIIGVLFVVMGGFAYSIQN